MHGNPMNNPRTAKLSRLEQIELDGWQEDRENVKESFKCRHVLSETEGADWHKRSECRYKALI